MPATAMADAGSSPGLGPARDRCHLFWETRHGAAVGPYWRGPTLGARPQHGRVWAPGHCHGHGIAWDAADAHRTWESLQVCVGCVALESVCAGFGGLLLCLLLLF